MKHKGYSGQSQLLIPLIIVLGSVLVLAANTTIDAINSTITGDFIGIPQTIEKSFPIEVWADTYTNLELGEYLVRATLVLDNGDLLENQQIDFYLNNTLLGSGLTNSEGFVDFPVSDKGILKAAFNGAASLFYNPSESEIDMLIKITEEIVQSKTNVTGKVNETIKAEEKVEFYRRLDCNRCGQHKAPPLTNVNMSIWVSNESGNITDYYPIEWTVTNAYGGLITDYNETYNKIEFDKPSAWYIIKSPQRTTPSTKYYFFSEFNGNRSDDWFVIVADPVWLNVTLITPNPDTCNSTDPCPLALSQTYWINATIECEDGDCGNVNGTARYNDSNTTFFQPSYSDNKAYVVNDTSTDDFSEANTEVTNYTKINTSDNNYENSYADASLENEELYAFQRFTFNLSGFNTNDIERITYCHEGYVETSGEVCGTCWERGIWRYNVTTSLWNLDQSITASETVRCKSFTSGFDGLINSTSGLFQLGLRGYIKCAEQGPTCSPVAKIDLYTDNISVTLTLLNMTTISLTPGATPFYVFGENKHPIGHNVMQGPVTFPEYAYDNELNDSSTKADIDASCSDEGCSDLTSVVYNWDFSGAGNWNGTLFYRWQTSLSESGAGANAEAKIYFRNWGTSQWDEIYSGGPPGQGQGIYNLDINSTYFASNGSARVWFEADASTSSLGETATSNIDLYDTYISYSGNNPMSCGNMNQGDTCQLNWTVNFTGNYSETYRIDVNFSSNPWNDTDDAYIRGSSNPPTYSDNSTNSTLGGTPVEFRLKWTDDYGLSGYKFSIQNGTGVSWWNDTWKSFTFNDYIYQRRPNAYDDADSQCTNEDQAYDYDSSYASCEDQGGTANTSWWNNTSQSYLGTINNATFGVYFNCTGTVAGTNPDNWSISYGFASTPGDCSSVGTWYQLANSTGEGCGFGFQWNNTSNSTPVNWTNINNTCWDVYWDRNGGSDGMILYIDAFHVDVNYTNNIEIWSNETYVINETEGTTIKWCYYANDSDGSWNNTNCESGNEFSFLTTYNHPQYGNNYTNATIAGKPTEFQLNWTDVEGLSGFILSIDNCTDSFNWNSSWTEMTGTQNWTNYSATSAVYTINDTVGCVIKWKVYGNDTDDKWNTSQEYEFTTTSLPWLNVTLLTPDPDTCVEGSPCAWTQNQTYWINATIECEGVGGCGSVNGTARYNDTTTTMKIMNITKMNTPFYIISKNAHPYADYQYTCCPSNPTNAYDDWLNDTSTYARLYATASCPAEGDDESQVYIFDFPAGTNNGTLFFTWSVDWTEIDSAIANAFIYLYDWGGSWDLVVTQNADIGLHTNNTSISSDYFAPNGSVKVRFRAQASCFDSTGTGTTDMYLYDTYISANMTGYGNSQPFKCGTMNENDECQINWTTNVTGNIGEVYRIDANFSSSTVASNNTSDAFVKITAGPWLNVTLLTPDPDTCVEGSPCAWTQNQTYWINATIECEDGDCGSVNGTARYNDTTTTMKIMNITKMNTPFYIISKNAHPYNNTKDSIFSEPENPENAYDDGLNDSSTFANFTNQSTGDYDSKSEREIYFWDFPAGTTNGTLFYTSTLDFNIACGVASATCHLYIWAWNWTNSVWDELLEVLNSPDWDIIGTNNTSLNSSYFASNGSVKVKFGIRTYRHESGTPKAEFLLYDTYISANMTGYGNSQPFKCGTMNENDECQINWTTNVTGNIGEVYRIDANFSSSTVASNNTSDAFVKITAGPWLNVTLLTPDPDTCNSTDPCLWNQYSNYWINATIECEDGDCGSVNGTARYNDSVENERWDSFETSLSKDGTITNELWANDNNWNDSTTYAQLVSGTVNGAYARLIANYEYVTTNSKLFYTWNYTSNSGVEQLEAWNYTSEQWEVIDSSVPASPTIENWTVTSDFIQDGVLQIRFNVEESGGSGSTIRVYDVHVYSGYNGMISINTTKGATPFYVYPIVEETMLPTIAKNDTEVVTEKVNVSDNDYARELCGSSSCTTPYIGINFSTFQTYEHSKIEWKVGSSSDQAYLQCWNGNSYSIVTTTMSSSDTINTNDISGCDNSDGKYIFRVYATDMGGAEGVTVYVDLMLINKTKRNNPKSCGNMNQDDECTVTWTVNTTGSIGSVWKIDTKFNSNTITSNNTTDAYVEISEGIPPTFNVNNSNTSSINSGEPVLIYANWSDNYALGYAWLSTNETSSWLNYTDGTYGSPIDINMTAGQTWSNFTWDNDSFVSGVVAWKIYANDSYGNENVTGEMTFSVTSDAAPTYSNNQTNTTVAGQPANFTLDWNDASGLAGYIFSTNNTGTWLNASYVSFSGSTNTSWNVTTLNSTAGTLVAWCFYANDTSGNMNGTSCESGNRFTFVTVPNYCDVGIQSVPYTITQNNTYYCLAKSFNYNPGAYNGVIEFNNPTENSTLDCLGYNLNGTEAVFSYGVYLDGSSIKNNIIRNCNITNFAYAIDLDNDCSNNTLTNNTANDNDNGFYSASDNNTISNNMANNNDMVGFWINSDNNNLTNNIANNNYDGFYIQNSNNSNLTNNTASGNGRAGIAITGSSNTIITNCTTHDNTDSDYYLNSAGTTNNFTNTNFTAARKIYFHQASSWFNYNNESTGNIWLKTNVSEAYSHITRELTNWSQTLMQWNDTNLSADITARYNITGLNANSYYNVYNNSDLAYNLATDASGNLETFTIDLKGEHEIKVEEDTEAPTYSNNQTQLVTVYTATEYSNFSITWNDNSENVNPYLENNFSTTLDNDSMSGGYPNYYYNSTVLAAGTYQFRFVANDSAGNDNATDVQYFTIEKAKPILILNNTSNVVNTSGLVGYWRFESVNSSNHTFDSSGWDNDGQLMNGTTSCYNELTCAELVTGRFGNAIEFKGNESGGAAYVDAGEDESLNISGEITISMWLKTKSTFPWGSQTRFIDKACSYKGFFGRVWDDEVNFLFGNGTGWTGVTANNVLILNKWHHVVTTFNGTNLTIYVDGELEDIIYLDALVPCDSAGQGLAFGSNNDGGGGNKAYNGTIDEVMIFNRSLSADEIKELYESQVNYPTQTNFSLSELNGGDEDVYYDFFRNGTVNAIFHLDEGIGNKTFDSVGNNISGTLRNYSTNVSWTTGKYGYGLEFIGSQGDVRIPPKSLLAFSTTDDFTIEAWAYPKENAHGTIVSLSARYYISMNPNTDKVEFAYRNSSGGLHYYQNTTTIDLNTWYHYVVVHNGLDYTIYLNGQEVGNGIQVDEGDWSLTWSYIGDWDGWLNHWNGTIDEVKIYPRVLTDEEVLCHFGNNCSEAGFYNDTSTLSLGYYYYFADASGGENYTKSALLIPLKVGCQVYINSLPYNITQNNTYYCLNTSEQTLTGTAIQFGNSTSWAIQNSTLDCMSFNNYIDGDDSGSTDYGVFMNSSDAINNTIKNCNITDFRYGIYLNSGTKNNTINNVIANSNDVTYGGGIIIYDADNNTINNVTANSHSYFGIADYSYSSGNTYTNIIAKSNSFYGFYSYTSRNNLTIINATLQDNDVWDFYILDGTTLSCDIINMSNINGTDNKPIVYYNYSVTIEDWDNNASEIILCDADNSVINNVTMYHTSTENNGIFLKQTDNSNVTNCNITDSDFGVLLSYSSNNNVSNNTFNSNEQGVRVYQSSSNTINNNTANSGGIGFYIYQSTSANNFYNNTASLNNYGISLYQSDNQNITNCSIFGNTYDYRLYQADDNFLKETNFTDSRTIRFYDSTSWFNYNNETTGDIWLKTNVSTGAGGTVITRELTNWSQTLMQWNDTNTTGTDITTRYNITGLKASKNYNVSNNSVLVSELITDSSGNLPSFTIDLKGEHEIKVEEIPISFAVTIPNNSVTHSSATGNATPDEEINSSTGNEKNLTIWVKGTVYKQNSTFIGDVNNIANYKVNNTGNVNENITMCINESLPASIVLFGTKSANPADTQYIIPVCSSGVWVANSSLPVDAMDEFWIWANFTDASINDATVRELYINSTKSET